MSVVMDDVSLIVQAEYSLRGKKILCLAVLVVSAL